MSKQRARRRAERQAQLDRQRAARARRRQRQATLERLRPKLPRQLVRRRRVARMWSRRSRAQRGALLAAAGAVVVLTFLLTDSWRVRLAVLALLAIAGPAVATLALGRDRG